MKFDKVNNTVVSGITSLNSMGFHYHVHRCSNLSFTNLTITAPGNSPNTDGMHISSSSLISVTESVIGTGDDCISIGHSTRNITIAGIKCGPGHGISVGSLGKRREEKTVEGVFVKNCSFTNTTNGARIKTWCGLEPAEAKNIIYENLIMNAVQNPIVIDQSYGKKDRVVRKQSYHNYLRSTDTSKLTCLVMSVCLMSVIHISLLVVQFLVQFCNVVTCFYRLQLRYGR